ncbi:MAG: hypothetical protein B9S32_08180 [Verrucomicrobia bacterium Tous-C9LFEB]|nr:MAG: hypothetical protein B9S32_08180 [Verrucomicrobia bacterium Tous-C9LFEB]
MSTVCLPRLSSLLWCRVILHAVVLAAFSLSSSAHAGWNFPDICGPDGIVYPNWTYTGLPGGIPTSFSQTVNAASAPYNAIGSDSLDDSTALQTAIEVVGSSGGGLITLPAGTYYLDKPLLIRYNNVVLRGAGKGSTTLVMRYRPPTGNVTFYQPAAGTTTIYQNTWVEIHADPVNLKKLSLYASGVLVSSVERTDDSWSGTFSLTSKGAYLADKAGSGAGKVITAQAEYLDGTIKTQTLTVTLSWAIDSNAVPRAGLLGAINFCGYGLTGVTYPLATNAKRGQMILQAATAPVLSVNDALYLHAPLSDEWMQSTGYAGTSDIFRTYLFQVTSISGTQVSVNQPLRIDYPLTANPAQTPFLQKAQMIQNGGVENLTIKQPQDLWTSGIVFNWGWKCWVKGVEIVKTGRFPIVMSGSKWCEIRDCTMDDAWWKGLAGTAYLGFSSAYDSLLENITCTRLRHAPCLVSAAGNVLRNSTFADSDMQWHAGWANENLYENLSVQSNRGNGGYGYGMWASPSEQNDHGPNGPRNTIYACDVTSPLAGAWMGGSNKEWIFAYNRLAADAGPGWFLQRDSGDHVIYKNAVVLGSATAGVWTDTSDCTGVVIQENTFRGIPANALTCGLSATGPCANNTTTDALTLTTVSNSGFENDLSGWTVTASDSGISSVSTAEKHSGAKSLYVNDTQSGAGSYVYSPAFPVQPGKVYATRFWQKLTSGSNLGVYLQFYDSAGASLLGSYVVDNTLNQWKQVVWRETAPLNAATAKIMIHSMNAALVTGYLDDFEFGEQVEALPNGSFGQGLAHWNNAGDNGMTVATSSAVMSGATGIRVTDTSSTAGSSLLSKRFAIQPGWTAQVRFWSRQLTSASGIAIYLRFYNAGGQSTGTTPSLQLPIDGAWKERSLLGVAPADAAQVEIWIHSYSSAQVTADFDCFSFLTLPPKPTPVAASIYDWQLAQNNSGFESDFTGWTVGAADNGMSQIVTTDAHGGSKVLRVTDASNTTGSDCSSPKFMVEAGTTYQVSFWSRLLSGTGIGVYLQFYDANNALITSGTQSMGIPSGSSWTRSVLTGVAPANALYARIWVHSYNVWMPIADFDDFDFRVN